MFRNQQGDQLSLSSVLHWYLLIFNAGCINAGGFMASGKFVSHVTGFATLFGVDLIDDRPESAWEIASVPIFFLLGSFISGMLIDRPVQLKKQPHFDYALGLSAICLFLAAERGTLILAPLGRFGQIFSLEQVYVLLAFLCLACGLQNAAVTSFTRSSVRTTHLTGITTDLGLGLARLTTYKRNSSVFQQEARSSLFRCGSILAFVSGSAMGSWFFVRLGYSGFLIPALISSYGAWRGRVDKLAANRSEPLKPLLNNLP